MEPEKPYGIVYLLRCRTSGKGYVGQTVRPLASRWQEHVRTSSCRAIHHAIKKYGTEAFEITELAKARDQAELNQLEASWIYALGTLAPRGYNLTEGGGQHGRPSLETLKRLKEGCQGRTFTPQAREAARLANTGKIHTAEHRAKNRLANLGRTWSQKQRSQIRDALLGKNHSEERRSNISQGRVKAVQAARAAGKLNYNASLTTDLVREILRRAYDGETVYGIAKEMKLSRDAVRGVVKGKTWKHVESEHRRGT